MPQCQFPVFFYFCVSEKLHTKYSRNWTKQRPKFLFFPTRDGVQSRDGGGLEGGHAMPWRGPPPGHARLWCGPLVHPLTSPFCLYILLDEKTLRARTLFQKKVLQCRRRRRPISGDRSFCSGTLPGRRSAPGAISTISMKLFTIFQHQTTFLKQLLKMKSNKDQRSKHTLL
jgi:hypothetical protein